MARQTSFFRGTELPRLLVLVGIMVVGLFLFWQYGRNRPAPVAPPAVVGEPPRPVEPDLSTEFESVTDRTPLSFRDTAAYKLLLDRARGLSPEDLAAESRRDVLLTHLWERPGRYRGVPIHLDGTALRVLRYESKLSKAGWLYEAWIETPDSGRFPYVCVFEDAPRGLPIGANVSEHVVFNGYFFKIMKYEAADVARGAPLLVGRIGWDPRQSAGAQASGSGSTLKWTLGLLAFMFVVTLARWIVAMSRAMGRGGHSTARVASPTDEIDPAALEQWVRRAGDEGDEPARRLAGPGARTTGETEAGGPGASPPEGSGAKPTDEAQSTSPTVPGG